MGVVLETSPVFVSEVHTDSLITSDRNLLHWVISLLPDVGIGTGSQWPLDHELELSIRSSRTVIKLTEDRVIISIWLTSVNIVPESLVTQLG
jgi:hypothetical protein